MRREHGWRLLLILTVGGFSAGCGELEVTETCPHVMANFSLRDIRLLDGEGKLLVTGTQKIGACSAEEDPDERHVVLQLAVSLADLATGTDVAPGVRLEDYPLPLDAVSVFEGELSSLWRGWTLGIPIEGEPFSLEFRTDSGGPPVPMRMTLLEGGQPRLEVEFHMLAIEVL